MKDPLRKQLPLSEVRGAGDMVSSCHWLLLMAPQTASFREYFEPSSHHVELSAKIFPLLSSRQKRGSHDPQSLPGVQWVGLGRGGLPLAGPGCFSDPRTLLSEVFLAHEMVVGSRSVLRKVL